MRRFLIGIVMAVTTVSSAAAQQQSFRDANGHFSGSAITHGNSTSFYDRNGSFSGSAIRNGNDTNFYGTHGHYQGTGTVAPNSIDRAFNFKR
jgi:opacity protein-like surface antigen